MNDTLASCPEFVISRTFDAPRDLVWKSLTEVARIQDWFTPKGFTARAVKQELRPGGTYHYVLTSPDGHEMWGKAVYREIEAPNRLVYINSFSDANGGTTHHPMQKAWPLELLTTYTLEENAGKTTMKITWLPINASKAEVECFDTSRDGMTQGWTGTLDNLAEYLAKQQKQ